MNRSERPGLSREIMLSCISGDAPVFTETKAAELVSAVGPMAQGRTIDALAVALSTATAAYVVDLWNQSLPTDKALEERANEIKQACRTLLNLVGVTGGREVSHKSVFPFLAGGGLYAAATLDRRVSGQDAVLRALQSVADLARWSNVVASRANGRVAFHGATAANRPKNRAYNELLKELTRLYFEGWDRVPGVSSSRSKGSAEAAELQAGRSSYEAELYKSGTALPQGFLRMLCEVSRVLNDRGIEAPSGVDAVKKAWHRLPKEDSFEVDITG